MLEDFRTNVLNSMLDFTCEGRQLEACCCCHAISFDKKLAAVRFCKICRLKIKFTWRDITSCFNLLNRPTHIKIGVDCSRDSFAIFLDIHTLEPYRVRKTDFSKLGWPFSYLISETKSVTPQFFCISDKSNS